MEKISNFVFACSVETILLLWSPGGLVPQWRWFSLWSSSLRWSSFSLWSLIKLPLCQKTPLLDTGALRNFFLSWNPTRRLLHILETAPVPVQGEELLLHRPPYRLPPPPSLQVQIEVGVWPPTTWNTVRERSGQEVCVVVLTLAQLLPVFRLPPASDLPCFRADFLSPHQKPVAAVVLPGKGLHQLSACQSLPPFLSLTPVASKTRQSLFPR